MATIVKSKEAVLLKLRSPKRITTVIPTAKMISHKGQDIVAVPHRPDETRILRQLGYDAPDPMKMHYEWPKASGKFTPFAAQIETANFVTMHNRCFILNSMGTGKTVSSLWAYDYMLSRKQVKKALIVCPLSTMERTWADEIFKTFPHLDAQVLYGSRERRQKLLREEAHLYIINIDGLKTIEEDLKKRPDIDLLIIDEVAMFRNGSTNRWKTMNAIANKQTQRRIWALTGMPTPNAPTDAWAQCKLVSPNAKNVPSYFTKARDALMRQISPFKWVARDNANDVVKEWMQPAIRYSLDDCTDLPPQIFMNRDVEMSDEQKKAYKEMLNKLKTEVAGGEVLAVNEAVKANKLVQIACGMAYAADGSTIAIPCNHRIEVLKEVIEESEGKVIVFVPLTAVLQHVAEQLKHHWEVAIVHGETPKNQRDEIFDSFQKRPDPHVIVANPGTMSHGLTLTAATTIIWYAPVHSNDTYEQACARVRRPGQSRTTVIVHIAASEVERRIYERLKTKQKMQGLLLDMMKDV
ncbi:HepA Superfamily II DNA/RNA helicases, SNF2 family [uncultured Caudovirales phage]|uniref:HepA Superfamily II DNA/RNA helicases, SNF2 family n=1 Tax=uncultured Caudovirales phage TaxID=2100421 RepID=A0A6J5LR45_9CAUD|nr:HepA Superfamily II DNA/RNA helicases, SNF2 family [uncultured Caudovirales phage]